MLAVRSATPADAGAVVDLWRTAAGPTHLPGGRAEVERLVARDPDALLLAEDDGELVASLIVGWDGWRCHLYRLAVEPSHRRHGVASRLVDAAEARARSLGARRLDAQVNHENGDGIAFWSNLGFVADADDRRWCRSV